MILCDKCGFEKDGVLCPHKDHKITIKEPPFYCVHCDEEVYTITFLKDKRRFSYTCPKCGEVYYL